MIGTRLAHYEITSHLGSGGMGDVYQATDAKLGRSVAIKLLPEAFTHDEDRAARFEREARVLASLNHPNIAAIYGIEQSGERTFLVMELVPGETLAERIRRGPIPVIEALEIAKQIAEGLEAAHDSAKPIIHRDLKPANVKITPDGKVKVLDFGLAKAYEAPSASVNLSNSPTLSVASTTAGVILGTAAYMSPEQAKGQNVDRRTDIFAFGAVLYEMLTGKQAFAGDTLSDILSRVILSEPDWSRLPNATPAAVRHLLKRCLQKDRSLRLRDIGDARLDILEPRGEVEIATPVKGRARLAWTAFGAVLLAAMALAIPALRYLRETRPSEMRVEINTPATSAATADLSSFALSPDGRQIVFVASGDGAPRLWLRSMGSAAAQPLTGTEGASYPFWSPNNDSIGFFADGKLKRFDIGGGPPQTVATGVNVNLPRGGTWNADGIILFVPGPSSPVLSVSASGGQAVAMEKLDGHLGHAAPYFLPDGRQFLFYARGTPETAGIYLGALGSTESQRLTPADTAGVYVSPGWLLWVREGALVGQHLDLKRKVLTGDPITLADSVTFDPVMQVGAIAASLSGLIAYRTGGANRRQLTWFDRSGRELGALGAMDENALSSPRVSPDGSRVAVHRTVQGNTDIWLMDATGTRMTRFTLNAATERNPIWSPDGNWIVFESDRSGLRDLYRKPSNGIGVEELLVEATIANVASDWSKDGRFILYYGPTTLNDRDLWVLPMDGVRKPWLFLKTGFDERWATLSPDGRWAAYISNESGPNEVYIRQFTEQAAAGAGADPSAGVWQVSTAAACIHDGGPTARSLFYVGSNGEMMAAPITATGTTLTPGTPVTLFPMKIFGGGGRISSQTLEYDVTRDGRFLINTVLDDASPITLLQNWKPPAD